MIWQGMGGAILNGIAWAGSPPPLRRERGAGLVMAPRLVRARPTHPRAPIGVKGRSGSWPDRCQGRSTTTRNPMCAVELSGVLEDRAATR